MSSTASGSYTESVKFEAAATQTPADYKKLFEEEYPETSPGSPAGRSSRGDSARSTRCIPYPGLRSFARDEVDIFCAREEQVRALRAAFTGGSTGAARRVLVVAGGSSSGKSSIIRAGLLASLNQLDVPGPAGGWYVAEFRPGKNPLAELVAGMAAMVTEAMLDTVADSAEDDTPEARETALDMLAIMPGESKGWAARAAADSWPSGFDRALRDEVSARLQPLLHSVDVAYIPSRASHALERFVRGPLDELDAARKPARSDRSKLLLYIDQFEEIFREEVDPDEREAIFELLRRVDAVQPDDIYIALSVRSEELHRCSAHDGIAGIVNRSIHLVELVKRRAIRPAILKPAQRVLMAYGFQPGDRGVWPFSEEALRTIEEAYDEAFRDNQDAEADALPQLQHFLRTLWKIAIIVWKAEQGLGEREFITIDLALLDRVEGWRERVNPAGGESSDMFAASSAGELNPVPRARLGRVLKASADACLNDAYAAWHVTIGSTDKRLDAHRLAQQTVKAALISLTQYDSTDRLVRHPREMKEILDNARAASGSSRMLLEAPLAAAMEQFRRGWLIDLRPLQSADPPGRPAGGREVYDVFHESLIRSWDNYRRWVEEARDAQRALRDLSTEIVAERHEGASPRQTNRTARAVEQQLAFALGDASAIEFHVRRAWAVVRLWTLGARAWLAGKLISVLPNGSEQQLRASLPDLKASPWREWPIQTTRKTLSWLHSQLKKYSAFKKLERLNKSRITAWASDHWAIEALRNKTIARQGGRVSTADFLNEQAREIENARISLSLVQSTRRRAMLRDWAAVATYLLVVTMIFWASYSANYSYYSDARSDLAWLTLHGRHATATADNSQRGIMQDRDMWYVSQSFVNFVQENVYGRGAPMAHALNEFVQRTISLGGLFPSLDPKRRMDDLRGRHAVEHRDLDIAIRQANADLIIELVDKQPCAAGNDRGSASNCYTEVVTCVDHDKRELVVRGGDTHGKQKSWLIDQPSYLFSRSGDQVCFGEKLDFALYHRPNEAVHQLPTLILLDWYQRDVGKWEARQSARQLKTVEFQTILRGLRQRQTTVEVVSIYRSPKYLGFVTTLDDDRRVLLKTNRALSQFTKCDQNFPESKDVSCRGWLKRDSEGEIKYEFRNLTEGVCSFSKGDPGPGAKCREADYVYPEGIAGSRKFAIEIKYNVDKTGLQWPCTDKPDRRDLCETTVSIYTRGDNTPIAHNSLTYLGPPVQKFAFDDIHLSLVDIYGNAHRIVLSKASIRDFVSERWRGLTDTRLVNANTKRAADAVSLLCLYNKGWQLGRKHDVFERYSNNPAPDFPTGNCK